MTTNVLIIDDSRSLREHAVSVLNQAGYKTLTASDGPSGLEMIEQHRPDVVLLDIIMPGMNGLEVLNALRRKKIGVSIVLLTVKTSVQEKVDGLNAGADDYIPKPFSDRELVARVNAAVRKAKIEKNLSALIDAKSRELVRKERQAVVGRMVQGFVHNLRGPMTSISGWADVAQIKVCELREKITGDTSGECMDLCDGIMHDLSMLMKGTAKARALIDCLLVRNSQDASDRKDTIQLSELVKQEIEFMKSDLDFKHGIRISFDLDAAIPSFQGYYTDFSQVIYNLVRNAADAMTDSLEKQLTIQTHCDEAYIYLSFRDTGCGICEKDMQRIFDPFFSTKGKKMLTGMCIPSGWGCIPVGS